MAFKGQKRYSRQIQPERIKYLAPVDENGLFAPPEPAADAPPLIKENQKELKKQYDRAIANMKAHGSPGCDDSQTRSHRSAIGASRT